MKLKIFNTVIIAVALAVALPVSADIDAATCFECHDDIESAIQYTAHSPKNHVACTACHGNAEEHVDDPSTDNIQTFDHVKAKTVLDTCKTCHTTYTMKASTHFSNGEACLECHQLGHSGKFLSGTVQPEDSLLKIKNSELCLNCHSAVRMKVNLPYNHGSDDYDNTCIECHNPHMTSIEHKQDLVQEKCEQCHPEAGGPFVYTHLGTEKYGCKECHDPHGSTHANLLNKHSVRFLCLSCHSDTPEFHDMSDLTYQQCTSCHTAVHGSNMNHLLFN